MTNLIPGFTWHPIDVAGRAKRVKGRGAVGHVAVSNSANLVPSGAVATRSADWHWYNPKVGPGIQYIDLDLQCWASGAGNKTLAAFESQGGMGTAAQVNAEPWNDNQLENAARFYAHLVETEGAPLQVMPNSLPGSRGLAGHRHGIDPWRVSGGELWSSSRGKLCPGDAKMAQLPLIVSRASEIVHGSPTPPLTVQEDEMRLIRTPDGTIWTVTDTTVKSVASLAAANALAKVWGPWQSVEFAEKDAVYLDADARRKDRLGDQQDYLLGERPTQKPYLYDRVVAAQAGVDAVATSVSKVQAPQMDEAKLAAALLSDADAVAKLGDAIAAGLATRVHNG